MKKTIKMIMKKENNKITIMIIIMMKIVNKKLKIIKRLIMNKVKMNNNLRKLIGMKVKVKLGMKFMLMNNK